MHCHDNLIIEEEDHIISRVKVVELEKKTRTYIHLNSPNFALSNAKILYSFSHRIAQNANQKYDP